MSGLFGWIYSANSFVAIDIWLVFKGIGIVRIFWTYFFWEAIDFLINPYY